MHGTWKWEPRGERKCLCVKMRSAGFSQSRLLPVSEEKGRTHPGSTSYLLDFARHSPGAVYGGYQLPPLLAQGTHAFYLFLRMNTMVSTQRSHAMKPS